MNPRRREPTRRELRAGSRRARDRGAEAKLDKLLILREHGASPIAIAGVLGMSAETIGELLELAGEGESKAKDRGEVAT